MHHTADPSSRRASLDKAQSRKALGSQKALNTQQTLQGSGVADGHQKPAGTAMNPLADVETGQMHHATAADGTEAVKGTTNAGVDTCAYASFFHHSSEAVLRHQRRMQPLVLHPSCHLYLSAVLS